MKAKEFGARPSNDAFRGGQRYSANGYNKSFKKERFPEAQEYANRNLDEYHRFEGTKDLTKEQDAQQPDNKQSDKSRKTENAKKARQRMLQQVVGIVVGSTVIVTSYQARVERLEQEQALEPVAVVTEADEIIPEEPEELDEKSEEATESENASSDKAESKSKSNAKSSRSKGSSSSRSGRGSSRSLSENTADNQNTEAAASENQNTNDVAQNTVENAQNGAQNADTSANAQSGSQNTDISSNTQNGNTNTAVNNGNNAVTTDNSQSSNTSSEASSGNTTQTASPSPRGRRVSVWEWNSDKTSVSYVIKTSSGNVISTTPAAVTTVEEPATCKAEGSITYTATVNVAGNSYTDTKYEVIQPLGHLFGSSKIVTLEDGQKAICFECARCHETFTIRNIIDEE